MRKTIVNWKQLGEIMNDPTMCHDIYAMTLSKGKLESLTFESVKDALREENEVKG